MPVEKILQARRASVSINDVLVGFLEKIANDEYRFSYAPNYKETSGAVPLSLGLPFSNDPVKGDALPAFFDNLLMEGRIIRRMAKIYGLDPKVQSDRFQLLLLSTQDTIGAVKILAIDDQNIPFAAIADFAEPDSRSYDFIEMASAYIKRCPVCLNPGRLHDSCARKLTGSKAALKIAVDRKAISDTFKILTSGASISGAQDKNLFNCRKGVFSPGIPSTHIIKPEGDYAEMPANEHLTMVIAKQAKFNVPPVGLFQVEDLGLLYIIKRFDRDKAGKRILVEDFAQILRYMEDEKEDGSMKEIAEAIDGFCSSPLVEKSDFFRRLLFCFVFGNGDIHLKNWSLIFDPGKKLYKLSPVYDWLNVRASMPREKVEMILPMGGKRSGFNKSDFVDFALASLQINEKYVQRCFDEIPIWLSLAETLCPVSALSDSMKIRYLEIVKERARRLMA